MQGLHHQQQQLAALLAVALPKKDVSPSASKPTENDDSARLSAISSLHRAILYPPNSLLVAHSASYLSQGLSQLLSDKSYAIRQSAATAYGALCAVVCSIPLATTGRQNHVLLGAMVDRFIGWALPLLSIVTAGDGTTELALDSLREFLNVGDVNGIERYALPILKACQQLLEDERTSLSLLHRLLGIVTLISLKFLRCFQPHFLDIVDLLLGWALVPDLVEADRRVIMDCFLQFQKHWVGNLQFSLGLLSKFLGDMESLLQDNALGTAQHFGRLLALLSCFSTVLQSTASGLLELNLLEQITEPLSKMLPRLLTCLSIIGRRFGWSKWSGDLWRCLTLLAEILREKFSDFYPLAVDTLFQSLEKYDETSFGGAGKSISSQVHGVLRTNLQLLSLQKLGLLPSSVEKIMHFDSPISQLRLHPNHVVTASSAATYVFLLQHGNNGVVEQAMASLLAELETLKRMIEKALAAGDDFQENDSRTYSNLELFALLKFDLKVLLTCVSLGGSDSLLGKSDIAILHLKRADMLIDFITKNLNPHEYPIVASVELQASVMVMLERLSKIEFLSKCSTCTESSSVDVTTVKNLTDVSALNLHLAVMEHFRKYGGVLVKALHVSAPLAIKLVSLEWVQGLCENIIVLTSSNSYFFRSFVHFSALWNVIDSILITASDKEPTVRSHVTPVLELLVKARLVHPMNFYSVVQIVLEKLGDPDNNIKNTFTGLLSHLLPDMIYSCGLCDYGPSIEYGPGLLRVNSSSLHWKQVFALKQLPQRLHAQQLVSVLSYISQRWKVPLSSWIQRLIQTCQKSEDLQPSQSEDTKELGISGSLLDMKIDEDYLENVCSANVLAAAWWAMQEAARYCIATRLRTNLGGPSQTFAALERMLLDISHLLQLDGEQNDGSLSLINSSGAHLLPMRLLLDFVEALKKNVYNAYAGSAILPSVSRPSSVFFRANKKVCEEWFSRICEPMLNAGLALQCPHATIEYCTWRLHDLNNAVASNLAEKSRVQMLENLQNIKTRFLGDVLRVLRHMALALCRSHEPEALIGLQTWALQKFSSLLNEETHSKDYSGDSGRLAWMNGLVYQAKGEYERSAAYFTHLLQIEESLSSMGSDGVQFAIARIIESYSAVSDWESLESWLLELQTLRAKHGGKSYSGALTAAGNDVNAIHALSHFDRSDFSAAWACLDLTPKSSGELTLDPKLALQRSEQMLLQAMLLQVEGKEERVLHDVQKAKLMLEEILSVLPLDGVEEAALCATQLHCILAFEDAFNAKDSQERSKQLDDFLVSPYVKMVHCPVEIARQDCNLWLKVLRVYRTISPSSPTTLNLCMNLSRLARKQKNLMLARRLNDYLGKHVHRCSVNRFRDFQISNLEYEQVLLMHAEDRYEDAFTNLWSYVRPCMVSSASFVPNADETLLKAKACLKLSEWLHNHKESCLEVIAPRLQEDFNRADFSCINQEAALTSDKISIQAIIDEISGTSIKLSTNICPSMGKTWMSYGSWCFNQARNSLLNPHDNDSALQSCYFSPFLESEVQPGTFKLNQDELDKVNIVISQMFTGLGENSLLKDSKGDENVNDIASQNLGTDHCFKTLVQQVLNIIESTAGAPGAENSSGECLSTTVASRIRICFHHANLRLEDTDFAIDQLVEIWWSLRRRRVNLFGHAARGFIQYLSYSSSMICNGEMVGSCYKSLKTGSYTLKATLYVLHILLNYGVELHDILEPSLSTVPLWPWQEVTPQLFARLSSHPEQLVRNQLQSLLMMLGKRSPWSIVYPTLLDANEANPSEELLQILGCLREQHPRLIQDVQLLIDELGNVTVLWEELWLSTLQDLHADVMRRIHVLREEAVRIAANVTLSQTEKSKINAAKYSAMMAPIFVTLERRLAKTSRKPETPHEMWFHQQYTEQLRSAISAFKTPPKSASAITDVWRPFDNIAASLASCQRKSSVSLGEVAPQLALLSSSDVPMPGLEKQIIVSESDSGTTDAQGIVTISSFLDQVMILSTKTKPKKINIMGSDGQKYTYLLKGREDLRLDARIMQLLQAINSLLQTSQATRGHLVGVRYYSVTPISGRAGLIQWVHNVTSIYSVFKCWQTRTQLAQQSANGDTKDAPPSVPRPSDMFYGKIIPALKEQGIKRVISRRDWPHDVKRKVLLDLMKEVPSQLLYQELWCASEGFKAFSSKLKRYSGSVAAMSMVGHILGLGDRHLDNILVDFYSGDVVHIDYNVCFDKGQRLKIPEIVPFRLTQIIEAALGLTGIEGTFRSSCEAVIDVMRKNKDILLMLLEVFVWDPLVEWTRGDFHDAAIGGEERKGMELAVSLSLFASRVQEIRIPLEEHRDLLLSTLPAIESSLEKFADVLSKYELVSAVFYQTDQERSNIILHETSTKSIVAEATSNAEKIRASFENHAREYSQAKAIVTEKAKEATNWMEQHVRVLDAVRGDLILEANAWIKLSASGEAFSLKSAVLVAGVPLSVVPEPTQVQCHDIDREVSQLVAELDHSVAAALGSLQVYSLALRRILPLSYHTTSSLSGWSQVLQLCSNVLSSETISLARRHAADLVSNSWNKGHDSIQNVHDDLCLKVDKYAVDVDRITREHFELVNSIGTEAETKAKERLLSGFMKYIQSEDGTHLPAVSGQLSLNSTRDARHQREMAEKKEKAVLVLNLAVISFYKEVHDRVLSLGSNTRANNSYDFSMLFGELEEQVEKCILLSSLVNEISQLYGFESLHSLVDSDDREHGHGEMFPSIFNRVLHFCTNLVDQMTEVALQDVVRAAISHNSEFMDMLGSISHVRGTIDTALEQLLEVELERASLVELEQNYFVKVGLITERQLALKEAAMKSRDHLSWEEAEELASQEEACRVQLDQLHQSWNQREKRTYYLMKRESEIKSVFLSCEHHFQTLVKAEEDVDLNVPRSKAMLAGLVKPFSELESIDEVSSAQRDGFAFADVTFNIADFINSGHSISENVWKLGGLVNNHAFFIWKVFVVDSFVDSCIQDIAASVDQSLGFDQLLIAVKRKLAIQLEKNIASYLKARFLPSMCSWLEKEIEHLKQMQGVAKESTFDYVQKELGAVKKVELMLEEYSNAHETARAAKSAAFLMEKKVKELKEAICKTILEIVQMEWMHDASMFPSQNSRALLQKHISADDDLRAVIPNLSRLKVVESLQSSAARIAQTLEGLQSVERTSLTAEGQLERAMSWACGVPTSAAAGQSSTKASGIPPEFHQHLMRRQQLIWDSREKASDIIKICMSVLEFEASRDGILWVPGEVLPLRAGGDDRAWQQAYFNAVTRLDVSYHSFSRIEQEWKMAQSSMEAASNDLYSATNELSIASLKAKTASDELQSTVLAMRDCAYEGSVALSAFSRVSKSHTALTSECGSMLEEVLAITDDLHDVHSLGKEAAIMHRSLMEDLSKANSILLPLESVLSKDVTAMTDAIARERETKMEISPIHGQAIYQSYSSRVKEAIQTFNPLLPLLVISANELYSLLIRLARAASLHAGNLHKAFEGVGESQKEKSQELDISKPDFDGDGSSLDSETGEQSTSNEDPQGILGISGLSLQDKGWISPPDTICSSSSESELSSTEASLPDSSIDPTEEMSQSKLLEVEDSAVVVSGGSHEEEESTVPNVDSLQQESRELKSGGKDENDEAPSTNRPINGRVIRGKNTYAMSVLRRVEMKLDGRDISDSREVSISDQVDYLLKQASSLDNLCNMYEGWTPWI